MGDIGIPLITADLESNFKKLKNGDMGSLPSSPPSQTGNLAGGETEYSLPQSLTASGAFGAHHNKKWVTASNISVGQPSFFSPVYTPIN